MKVRALIKDVYYYSWLSIFCQWLMDKFFVGPYFHIIKNTEINFVGGEPEPGKNYLVVSNHRSYDDPPLLGHAINFPVSFIAKKELFKNPLLYLVMMLTSTISIDREKTELQTFKAAKKALASKGLNKKPWCVGVFVEGTRSKIEGMLGKPNKGVILLARMAKVPIIPMGISYRGDRDILIKIGEAYEVDHDADLMDQAWDCLAKIEKLTDYTMPERNHIADASSHKKINSAS